jgi:hypothetical protein
MKAEFLKLAKVKDEKSFYKKYPTEEAFFKAHPEAKKHIKKAQVGLDVNKNGIPDEQENTSPQNIIQNFGIGAQTLGRIQGTPAPITQPGMQGSYGFGGMNYTGPQGAYPIDTSDPNFMNKNTSGAPYANSTINKNYTGYQGVVNNEASKSLGDKAAPYIGAAKDIISGIGSLKAQGDEKDRMRQMRKLTDVMKIASGTRDLDASNVISGNLKRQRDAIFQVIEPDQLSPTYGVGTNPLARNGAMLYSGGEIQNTYAPGYLYDNLGYEPLNDSEQVKQYYRGGRIPMAQDGGGFMDFMQSQGGGQALGMLTGALSNNSGESQIGQGIGTIAGAATGIPGAHILGGALGGLAGGMFNTSQKSIKNDRRAIQKNVDTMIGNQYGQAFHQGSVVTRNGGNFPNYEKGGQLTNPQLITRFGELDEQDFYDYAHEGMDTLRAGGNLRSYTPPTNRAMQTYEDGGNVNNYELGEVEVESGGYLEPISYNPYNDGTGITSMIRGQSHDEYDSKLGHSGVILNAYGNQFEAERGEPIREMEEGGSVGKNKSAVITGNLVYKNLNNMFDPKYKKYEGKKIKNIHKEIALKDQKLNKLEEKNINKLVAYNPKTSQDKLYGASLEANEIGIKMQYKNNAKDANYFTNHQSIINDTAEEQGLVADDLAKGKIKINKEALKEYAEYGKAIKKAEPGTTVDDEGKKITKAERERLLKSGKYKIDPSNPKRIYRVETKDATSEEKKSATAMDNIPKQSVDQNTGLFGGVTPEQFEEYKKKNSWYNWDGFDPTDPEDVDKYAKAFNAESEKRGSKARILPDVEIDPKTKKPIPGTKTKYVGKQVVSANLEDTKKETPGATKSDYLEVEDEDKTYATTPYKRSIVMDAFNAIRPFIIPTDQEDLDPNQLTGEMYALSNNQLEPVQAQSYQPDLGTPYDISLQDQLNANQADFNATQRMVGYNPAALAQLNAQKYAANTGVLGEQFRMNQAMRAGVYDKNRDILNDAKLKNLAIYDQQYGRQAQAKSNTKAITQAALNSISDKYAKNRLENRELGIYENMYNYRFDPAGRAINMNPLYQPNMPTVYSEQKNANMLPVYDADGQQTGWRPAAETPGIVADGQTQAAKFGKAVKKYAKNGSIVKSYKNL